MVTIKGKLEALSNLRGKTIRFAVIATGLVLVGSIALGSCTARVAPNEFGVEQVRFGSKSGVSDRTFDPGIYYVGAGTTMHTFPREIHVLEATDDYRLTKAMAPDARTSASVDRYFENRDALLGDATHRVIGPINIQTSDGYAVSADVTLLYAISDPVKIARDFGWGAAYVDSFVTNTFRNGVLSTLGKMSAESFYGDKERTRAVAEAEARLKEQFEPRGFKIHMLLVGNYRYSEAYERSLQDKKVAVQLTEKNKKESLVNEERAKLQAIESKGQATITIAESEVNAQISKITAEAELYSAETRTKGDKELALAAAEAKRLKAEALNVGGGRYVLALESAKMFDNIELAIMTPEQYTAFIRATWSLIGVSGQGGN
jgi:regulator of protease activity HflC (stomatin/prohibitin superfamily)